MGEPSEARSAFDQELDLREIALFGMPVTGAPSFPTGPSSFASSSSSSLTPPNPSGLLPKKFHFGADMLNALHQRGGTIPPWVWLGLSGAAAARNPDVAWRLASGAAGLTGAALGAVPAGVWQGAGGFALAAAAPSIIRHTPAMVRAVSPIIVGGANLAGKGLLGGAKLAGQGLLGGAKLAGRGLLWGGGVIHRAVVRALSPSPSTATAAPPPERDVIGALPAMPMIPLDHRRSIRARRLGTATAGPIPYGLG